MPEQEDPHPHSKVAPEVRPSQSVTPIEKVRDRLPPAIFAAAAQRQIATAQSLLEALLSGAIGSELEARDIGAATAVLSALCSTTAPPVDFRARFRPGLHPPHKTDQDQSESEEST